MCPRRNRERAVRRLKDHSEKSAQGLLRDKKLQGLRREAIRRLILEFQCASSLAAWI